MRPLLLLSRQGGAGKTFLAANLLPLLKGARALETSGDELGLHQGKESPEFSPAALDASSEGRAFTLGAKKDAPDWSAGEGWLIIDGVETSRPGWEAWLEAAGGALLCERGDLAGIRRMQALLKDLEAGHFKKSTVQIAFSPVYASQPLPDFEGIQVHALPEFPKAVERLAQGLVPSAADPFSPFGKSIRQLAEAVQSLPAQGSAKGAPAAASTAEPGMEDALKRLLPLLKSELNLEQFEAADLSSQQFRARWEPKVRSLIASLLSRESGLPASREFRADLENKLVLLVLGLGPLEPLLQDPDISEIMVNRADQIFVERKGKLTLSEVKFWDDAQLQQVIERIVAPLGRRIDESSPKVDARLPDGSRVNAIIPPLALKGPCLTIRKFPSYRLSAQDLVKYGSLTDESAIFLREAVERRMNIVVSGGTGSGKTTLLNVLSSFIPEDERIVTVEDSAELKLQQEHVVSLESRPKNLEGKGEVSIRDLVVNCLRMRPDRIVVGECRGGEALDMLQAMNTGHTVCPIHYLPIQAGPALQGQTAIKPLRNPRKSLLHRNGYLQAPRHKPRPFLV